MYPGRLIKHTMLKIHIKQGRLNRIEMNLNILDNSRIHCHNVIDKRYQLTPVSKNWRIN